MFDVQFISKDGTLLVNLTGRLDTATNKDFNDKFAAEVRASAEKRVVVDLSRVTYISSVGLSSMLKANQEVKEKGGELVLCGLTGMVREVFQITGFLTIFKIFDTAEAAIAGH